MARWQVRVAAIVAAILAGVSCASSAPLASGTTSPSTQPGQILHYAANRNFTIDGRYRTGPYGYTLADVESPVELADLPAGVSALVYLGMCDGATLEFRLAVDAYLDDPKVFGFYLIDVPDPSSCPASNLADESDYIHEHVPGTVTFVLLQNLSSSQHPSYVGGYTSENSHVDLFGVAPYPCRTELDGCDFAMIDRFVRAALDAAVYPAQIVPVFQAFGGGEWTDDGDGYYQMPTAAQTATMMCRWQQLIPAPVFDYTYSWGRQRGDTALAAAPPDLQSVFAAHNSGNLAC